LTSDGTTVLINSKSFSPEITYDSPSPLSSPARGEDASFSVALCDSALIGASVHSVLRLFS
jgi:hypothetical protein